MFRFSFLQSIKTKLCMMFMIAGAIPMIVSMAVINDRSEKAFIAKAEESLVESATTRESMLNDHVESLKTSAKILSNQIAISKFITNRADNDPDAGEYFEAAWNEVVEFQSAHWGSVHHVFLTDISGTVILSPAHAGMDIPAHETVSVGMQSPHLGDSIADSKFFLKALSGVYVTDFFGFVERDHYHQLVLHPVFDDDGQAIGVIAMEVTIESIEALMRDQFSIGETGKIYIATHQGLRVVHRKEDFQPEPIVGTGVLQAIDSQEPVSGWYEPEPGRKVFGVYQASRIYPWVVCVEVDRDELFAPVRAQQRLFFAVMLASLSVFGVMVYSVGRMFWKPLQSIAASTNRVADGDLWHEIPTTRKDEIGQLESAVNAMRIAMKQQIDRLDSLIAERTVELEEVSSEFKHAAEHDLLTELANRSVLEAMLEQELEKYKDDSGHLISVLFFDFDRFKVVNDSLGHATGDALLCSIADRFQSELRDSDLAARFGGDEFVVVLSPVETEGHAHQAAARLLKVFEEPHVIDGHRITSTASIGLVIADSRYTSAAEMIRDADAAMYQAKLAGKGQVIAFDEEMFEDAKRRLRLEENMNDAIANDELRVMYQPIIGMDDMSVVGFEALMRWEHPELGMIRPDHFIPIAEDTGQIVELGAWILKESIEQIVRWDQEFSLDATLSINVNVAKRQLIHPEFLGMVEQVLKDTGLAPHRLKIEITESTAIDPRHDMSLVIKRIRELGVLIAMDDFGTGHSSLSLLHQFDFDILKIDQSFVQGMEDSREMSAVLHAIIALAQNTGMKVVAEGAETETQVACLISHECDMIQGYYFSRPLPSKEAGEFLAEPFDIRRAA